MRTADGDSGLQRDPKAPEPGFGQQQPGMSPVGRGTLQPSTQVMAVKTKLGNFVTKRVYRICLYNFKERRLLIICIYVEYDGT